MKGMVLTMKIFAIELIFNGGRTENAVYACAAYDETISKMCIRDRSVHSTIRNITRVCGLPKGITTKTIRKAFIVSELENGTKPKEIKDNLHMQSIREVMNIKDEYDLQVSIG